MLEIHAVTPDRLADFLDFFDHDGFADNAEWASCYCQCYYEDHTKVKWSDRTAAQNRQIACDRIAQSAMQGYLAYHDGKVVGWCNAAPRTLLHTLDGEPLPEAETTGTIICFLIAPGSRRKGVARSLLAAACDGLRARGMAIAEACPRPSTTSVTENHHGPLSMYLAAGFQVCRIDPDGSVWVCKDL